MRHFLIPVMLLGLIAGCSSVKITPHRIDVQQGNALDQENVSRLKPGLNRAQVRFLLGTPLVVDPFRTDRWDYVYVLYKAGKLAEQKHITLIFEGDTLARIEGDVPEGVPAEATTTEPATAPRLAPTVSREEAVTAAPSPAPAPSAAATTPAPQSVSSVGPQPPAAVAPVARQATAPTVSREQTTASTTPTSVVAPLPSPKGAPAYVDPRAPAELSLSPETDVERIQPDVTPPFPEPRSASGMADSDDPVLQAVKSWADAWARQDEAAYFSAYAPNFVPSGSETRQIWEARRRALFGSARSVDLKVDHPVVQRMPEGDALVTFNQFYRSDSHRDAVVKQLRLVERDGRWMIVEERVLSTLRGKQP